MITVRVLDGCHAGVELLLGDVQSLAELECVESAFGLVHHHHDVVGWLIEHQKLPVAVGDDTSGGEINLLEESVGVGTLLVVIAGNL